MDDLDYLMINPLQIELILSDNSNHTTNNNTPIQQDTNVNNINNEREITKIEERFYDKLEKLKNISSKNNRLRYMIQHINHRLILVDV